MMKGTIQEDITIVNIHAPVFPGGSEVKVSASNVGDPGSIPELESSLEKENTTHSSTLA